MLLSTGVMSQPCQLVPFRHHEILTVARRALLASIVLGVVFAAPRPASACSCLSFWLEANVQDGETGVPTNFAPLVSGVFDRLEFTSASGEPVDAAQTTLGARVCTNHSLELKPKAELEPMTEYVLRASGGGMSDEVRFTTGAGAEPLVSDRAIDLSAVLFNAEFRDSCGIQRYVCLKPTPAMGAAPPQSIEVILTSGDEEVFHEVFQFGAIPGVPLLDVHLLGERPEPDCVEIRARDRAGRRSGSTRLCGTQFPKRPGGGFLFSCASAKPGDFEPVPSVDDRGSAASGGVGGTSPGAATAPSAPGSAGSAAPMQAGGVGGQTAPAPRSSTPAETSAGCRVGAPGHSNAPCAWWLGLAMFVSWYARNRRTRPS